MSGTTAFMIPNSWKYQSFSLRSGLQATKLALLLSLPLSACSSSGDDSASEGTAGASAGTSSAAGSGAKAGSSAGGAGAGAAGASGGQASAGQSGSASSSSDDDVGYFTVALKGPDETSTTGITAVIGKVNDGPTPASIIWTAGTDTDGCHISKPTVPFCNTPCGGTAVCVADDVCQPYPKSMSVGTVHVTGLKTTAGASDFSMDPIANSYQPPAGTTVAYPPFAPGDAVTFEASGGAASAFSLSAKGVAPLELTSKDLALQSGQALHVTWTAGDTSLAQIHVKLDISHHGGSKGMIECDTADDGSLDIPASLMTDLLALGSAGFPTIIVTRLAESTAHIPQGVVTLTVSSQVESPVTVPGLTSCNEDGDCPSGKTCQKDLSCSK